MSLPLPLRWLSYAAFRAHRALMGPFDQVWIPDIPGPDNLSGALSGAYALPAKARFVGPLSRFAGPAPAGVREQPLDLLVMVSGPEPQRTVLERLVERQAKGFAGRALVVLGTPGLHQDRRVEGTVTFVSHLPGERLHALMCSAKAIVCRGGYTTIMELASLNRTAVLVPTPGQTEQEYLCRRMAQLGRAVCRHQQQFDLGEALAALRALPVPNALPDTGLLDRALDELTEALE